MKIKIRKSVFETNSSSVHALCLSEQATTTDRKEISFYTGWYSWEFDVIGSMEGKASYFYTMICEGDCDRIDERENALRDILSGHGISCVFHRPEGKRVEIDGAHYMRWEDSDSCLIDHSEEVDAVLDRFFANPDDIFNLLMNDDSFIVIGNDNDDDYHDYMNETHPDTTHRVFIKGN